LELEIMVVPGKAVAGLFRGVANLCQTLAEAAPAGGIGWALVGHQKRTDEQRDAESVGNFAHAVESVLERVDREMPGRHGEPVLVEFGAKGLGIIIDATEAFDLGVAELAERRQDAFPGL